MRDAILVNVAITLADTEYSTLLPAGTFQLFVKCQDATAIRIAFVTGKVATPTAPYYTIISGTTLEIRGLDGGEAFSLYIGCASNPKVAEVLYWVH